MEHEEKLCDLVPAIAKTTRSKKSSQMRLGDSQPYLPTKRADGATCSKLSLSTCFSDMFFFVCAVISTPLRKGSFPPIKPHFWQNCNQAAELLAELVAKPAFVSISLWLKSAFEGKSFPQTAWKRTAVGMYTHTQQSISSRIGNYWKRCTKATRNGDGHVQRLKPSNLGSPNSTAQWKLSSYIKWLVNPSVFQA